MCTFTSAFAQLPNFTTPPVRSARFTGMYSCVCSQENFGMGINNSFSQKACELHIEALAHHARRVASCNGMSSLIGELASKIY